MILNTKYDPFGRRILKISKPCTSGTPTADQTLWNFTYYVNDASGNVMAVYDYKKESAYYDITLKEEMIYGSSRLGMNKREKLLSTFTISGSVLTNEDADETERFCGKKRYEYSNHLGNVLLVSTDRKMSIDAGTPDGTIDFYECVIDANSDFGPYGNVLDGRNYGSARYTINSQESDPELYGANNATSAEYWMYDPRLGRRWNVDPVVKANLSGYSCFKNNPIIYLDPLGNTEYFSNKGEWIGSDGVDNGKKVMALSVKTEKKIKKATANREYISLNQYVYKDLIDVPSETQMQAFDKSYEETSKTRNEHGTLLGYDSDGKESPSIIDEGTHAMVDLGWLYIKIIEKEGGSVAHCVHSHPPMLIYTRDEITDSYSINYSGCTPSGTAGDEDNLIDYFEKYNVKAPIIDIILGWDAPRSKDVTAQENLAKNKPGTWIPYPSEIVSKLPKRITFFDLDQNQYEFMYDEFKDAVSKANNNTSSENEETICTDE